MRRHRGFSLLELLAAVVLLSIAAAGALATWSMSSRAAANKRVTEMGVYCGVHALERLKTQKYMGLPETGQPADPNSTPLVYWYDRNGQPAGSAQPQGYRARGWVSTWVNRDSVTNTEDLRAITVQVTDNSGAREYDRILTLITFGGI
jgi:prepilin-type N-terminal cleavage/methylation domain-containing protein